MANFEQAYDIVIGYEGGYVNDPDDFGGETYMGISRRYNPQWEGWNVIDDFKQAHPNDFPEGLELDDDLEYEVGKFYEMNYWDKMLLDDVNSQRIAEELMEIAVNMGVETATTFLQMGLNYFSENEELFEELDADGIFGPLTLNALQTYSKHYDDEPLLKLLNVFQAVKYMNIVDRHPEQGKFFEGWLKRITL
jgi:lysozyme family protein